MKQKHELANKEWEVMMTEKTLELNKVFDDRIKIMEKRLITEKEEMMDAMAQEINEIDKKNKLGKQMILEEKKKLEVELESHGRISRALDSNLSAVALEAKALSKYQNNIKEMIIVDLNEMRKSLLTSVNSGLIGKIKALTDELATSEARYVALKRMSLIRLLPLSKMLHSYHIIRICIIKCCVVFFAIYLHSCTSTIM